MPLLSQRLLRAIIPACDGSRAPATREAPERIVLGVRPGHSPSSRPVVRIFLGSERAQFRAERVFLWSIEKHRDPSRIYEIHLLKELRGFRRGLWLTGFTNYRFAIPWLCGYQGRAIYNDTDQVYLRDPALLFDTEMNGAGFLAISDRDTSVMLMDCAAMAHCWSQRQAHRLGRKQLEARARHDSLWGPLDPGWNARDEEYKAESAHLVHFTTLHTQPWRPLPEQFVYFGNHAVGELWHALEQEADDARYLPCTAANPSSDWAAARAVLECHCSESLLAVLDPVASPTTPAGNELVVENLLEHVPDADLPWVLDRLLAKSPQVQLRLREPLRSFSGPGSRLRRSPHFWLQQLQSAERRNPGTQWRLVRQRGWHRNTWFGGNAPEGDILVLRHVKPGHNQQASALSGALAQHTGRGTAVFDLPRSEAAFLLRRLGGRWTAPRIPATTAVIVASGWLPTRYARWLQKTTGRDVRLVLMGRKAGPAPAQGAAVVRCGHFGLPVHPAQIETLLPLNGGGDTHCTDTDRWSSWLQSSNRIALLVGGDSRSHRLDAAAARSLVEACSELASQQGAALLVVTSRRTGRATEGLRSGLGAGDLLYEWQSGDTTDNPYNLALQHAHSLVVTGESESMLADAIGAGKTPLIWPLATRKPGIWQRFCRWVAATAIRPRYNRRGSIRPQQGVTYLCARALERGWILPPRRTETLHDTLVQAGLASLPGTMPPERSGQQHRQQTHEIAGQVARLLGLAAADSPRDSRSENNPGYSKRELSHASNS